MKLTNKQKNISIFLTLFIFATLAVFGTTSRKNSGGAMAISDGKGNVELLWFPPAGKWSVSGWNISDENGKINKKPIKSGNKKWIKKLSEENKNSVAKLIKALNKNSLLKENNSLFAILAVKSFTVPYFAKAMGLSVTLKRVRKGKHLYTIRGASKTGNSSRAITLRTTSVNGYKKTPPPKPQVNFRGKLKNGRFALYWDVMHSNRQYPVFSYYIKRIPKSGKIEIVTPKPLILSEKRDPEQPVFFDDKPLFEEEVIYKVESIDVFGRHSEPSMFSISIQDPASKYPPDQKSINVKNIRGVVILNWKPKKNKKTAGYLIERSNSADGIYMTLTEHYLPVNTKKFKDKNVTGGTTYFYRIRSVRTDGNRGEPSFPVSVTAKNSKTPSKITDLSAKRGRTRIHLEWKNSNKYPVAGYLVERKAKGKNWERINRAINQLTFFNDNMRRRYSGTFYYRVTVIAFDNQQSAPSKPVKVFIPSREVPSAPYILNIIGKNSKAVIEFKPAYPPEKTKGFYILRCGDPGDKGVVISDKLPLSSRKYTDKYVSPGNRYWYKIVAVGKNNKLSPLSVAQAVFISNSLIPTPETPVLRIVSSPFLGVKILFENPEANLSAMVERKLKTDKQWELILGPLSNGEAIDTNPPKSGTVLYRIIFRSKTGATGNPSETAEIKM